MSSRDVNEVNVLVCRLHLPCTVHQEFTILHSLPQFPLEIDVLMLFVDSDFLELLRDSELVSD